MATPSMEEGGEEVLDSPEEFEFGEEDLGLGGKKVR